MEDTIIRRGVSAVENTAMAPGGSATQRVTDPLQSTDDYRPCRFARVLRDARRAIPPEAASLGHVLRLPWRVGKAVSQEEVAEAVGISRVWYNRLEAGRSVRISVALLHRIANTLMLNDTQRAELFPFAPAEISSRAIELRHGSVLEACGRIRRSAKRLWSASSVEEALTIAAEESMTHFSDAALVLSVHRIAPGRWNRPLVADGGMGRQDKLLFEDLAATLGPECFDDVALYPMLCQPGDIATRESVAAASIGAAYEAAVARQNLQRSALLHVRIRSRGGVIGGITVKHASERDYSEIELAGVATIASLTSLALS
jgi:transcriptional regulator with XRE-family HTH domain